MRDLISVFLAPGHLPGFSSYLFWFVSKLPYEYCPITEVHDFRLLFCEFAVEVMAAVRSVFYDIGPRGCQLQAYTVNTGKPNVQHLGALHTPSPCLPPRPRGCVDTGSSHSMSDPVPVILPNHLPEGLGSFEVAVF